MLASLLFCIPPCVRRRNPPLHVDVSPNFNGHTTTGDSIMKYIAIAVLAAFLGACVQAPTAPAVEKMAFKTVAQGGDYDVYHIDP